MTGLWAGRWLHGPPEAGFREGRRAIVKRQCFGPLEAWAWGVCDGGGYYREIQVLEGLPEKTLEPITRSELLEVITREIALCREHQAEELAGLLEAERKALELEE